MGKRLRAGTSKLVNHCEKLTFILRKIDFIFWRFRPYLDVTKLSKLTLGTISSTNKLYSGVVSGEG